MLVPLKGKNLLVVDSHASVRQSVVNFLAPGEINVQCVSNAPEAIKALRNAHGTEQSFDYVLIDLALPGMDGIELSKAIRADQRFSNLEIILMTAQIGAVNSGKNPAIKISGYIDKPLKPDALISVLLTPQYTGSRVDHRQFRRADPSEASNQQKPNILVVEDNYINQQVVIEMLKNLHCGYHLAENGQDALNVLSSHTESFDLILMDCQMPLMNGYEATRHIRANENEQFDRNIPIVALTANAMKGDDVKCFEAGMNDYLSKPFLSEQLAEILHKWVLVDRRR
jgi:CheY-like chemotaxis protein